MVYCYNLPGLPGAPFAEASKLVPPWDSRAVPGLPAEELGGVDTGSPGCSNVTDWRMRVAVASMEPLWVNWPPATGEVMLEVSWLSSAIMSIATGVLYCL